MKNPPAIIAEGAVTPPPSPVVAPSHIPSMAPQPMAVREGGKLTQKQQEIVFYAIAGLSGLAAITIITLLVRRSIRKARQRHAFQKTLKQDEPEAYANRIQMAFENDGWWGTDVAALRKVFLEIPTQDFYAKVADAYPKLTKGKTLEMQLKSELTSQQLNELIAIVNAKPSKKGEPTVFNALSIAKRLHAAMNEVWFGFWETTDDDALKMALNEIPSQAAWNEVADAYQKEYATPLAEDLDDDLWMWGDLDWKKIKNELPLSGLHKSFTQVWGFIKENCRLEKRPSFREVWKQLTEGNAIAPAII